MSGAEPPAPTPRPTGMLQKILACMGCMIGMWARKSQEQSLVPPLTRISPLLLNPFLLSSIFSISYVGMGFSYGISSSK